MSNERSTVQKIVRMTQPLGVLIIAGAADVKGLGRKILGFH
jgi:hypothetical protein